MKHTSNILTTLLLTGIMGSAFATAKPLKVQVLDVPKMPFVIGVLGVNDSYIDNSQADRRHVEFQEAMAAAADLPEFEGNVFAVHAGLCWDKLQSEADILW